MDESSRPSGGGPDVGEYCRQVEEHLARVNEGRLIRIVGPGFELVRGWALEEIPLSVVRAAIAQKAERHRAGRSTRPLRLEFCEADVRALYDDWRRAVGLSRAAASDAGDGAPAPPERRKSSLAQTLDRAIDRLSRAAGRLDAPESLREAIGVGLEELTALHAEVKAAARGATRDALSSRLAPIQGRLAAGARVAAGADGLDHIRRDAEAELAAYRGRLAPDAWARSVEMTVDRLLRERFGLPTVDPES